MKKQLLNIRFISTTLLTLATTLLFAQSPTAPAKNFNVFTLGNTTLINNESEGPIAIGGDLTIAGSYQIAVHNTGTFKVNNVTRIITSAEIDPNNNRVILLKLKDFLYYLEKINSLIK